MYPLPPQSKAQCIPKISGSDHCQSDNLANMTTLSQLLMTFTLGFLNSFTFSNPQTICFLKFTNILFQSTKPLHYSSFLDIVLHPPSKSPLLRHITTDKPMHTELPGDVKGF